MKWWQVGLTSIVLVLGVPLQSFDFAQDEIEIMAEDDAFLSLESEIESILEDQIMEETELDPNFAFGDYDQIEEVLPIIEEIKASPAAVQIPMPVSVEEQTTSEESLAVKIDRAVAEEEEMVISTPVSLEEMKEEAAKSIEAIEINLRQVFSGSPIIYIVLLALSVLSFCIWLYSMLTIRSGDFLPPAMIKELRTKLMTNQYDEALDLCVKKNHFFCRMLASGILARRHGLSAMVDTMKAEGKRSTISFWQRIGILNEIAVIAPMIGLLGTVMGMFYAFYDLNRSVESVSLLFDGLGVSVGTTVGGLVVAILAMILHSIAKYRLVKVMASVENEAQTFATMIDTKSPNYAEKG